MIVSVKVSALTSDTFMLKQATDNLYKCVDEALPKLMLEVDRLGSFVKERFKNRQALVMVPNE